MFTLLQNTVLIQKHAMSNYCSNKHPNPYSRIRPHTQTPHTQGPPTNGTSKTRRKYDQLLSFLLPPSLISLTAVPDFFLSQPQEDKPMLAFSPVWSTCAGQEPSEVLWPGTMREFRSLKAATTRPPTITPLISHSRSLRQESDTNPLEEQ